MLIASLIRSTSRACMLIASLIRSTSRAHPANLPPRPRFLSVGPREITSRRARSLKLHALGALAMQNRACLGRGFCTLVVHILPRSLCFLPAALLGRRAVAG
jgi:hypothetical protein